MASLLPPYLIHLLQRHFSPPIVNADPRSKVDKVDTVMDTVREQMDLSNEISEAISNPVGMGQIVDEDELEAELEALEQEELDDRLKGADHVPVHTPVSPVRVSAPSHQQAVDEDDEEAQLRQLQAELAM
jgi:charged multivesicular body protein 4